MIFRASCYCPHTYYYYRYYWYWYYYFYCVLKAYTYSSQPKQHTRQQG